MPRSDPMRSDYCAGRHLLRHLGDARALRRNPLAQRWIAPRTGDPDALASVGGAVRRALAAMDGEVPVRRWRTARHTVILLRMDVGAEAADAVATDLGLSQRQLRRERRLAHDRFLEAFRSLEPGAARVSERTADLQIDHASRLADSGEATSALAILEDVARRAAESTARCRALVRAADVEMELHRLASAKTRLSDA